MSVSGWKKVKLGEVSKTNVSSYTSKEKWLYVNYLDTGNITKNQINQIQLINLETTKLPSRAKRKVKVNDIIFSTVRPNQYHYGIIKEYPKNFLISTGFTVISVNPKIVDAYYIYFYLTRKDIIEGLSAIAEQSVSAYPSIKTSDLESLKINLPPLATQKQIAKVLSALDEKIELNNKINKNLEEQALMLYDNQFAKLDKNGKLKDIICEYPKSKINVSKAKGVIGDYPFYTSGRAILQYPTYLVNGRNCYLNTGGNADVKFHIGKASYSTDTWCITGTNGLSDYLYLLLSSIKTELNNKYFEGSALKHLQKNNLKDRKIYIPSHKQILKFNKLVYPIFDCIVKNTKENQKLAQLRDTLLPRLMSGKIDVSKVEI